MNLFTVMEMYPDQQSCIEHLEEVRWRDDPSCPFCGSIDVARKKENDRVGRWNCHDCHSSFNVLSGTVMQQTRVPLQKWFVGIALTINAKKGISSCQMSKDLGMDQKTCWYMQQRIRSAMEVTNEKVFLRGIVEADETYLGGKPRFDKEYYKNPPKRGRGTKKAAILGAVQRGGKVIAKMTNDVSKEAIFDFLCEFVDFEDSMLITDSYRGYDQMGNYLAHYTIEHWDNWYTRQGLHTNTIEGFWSHLKRAMHGQHHHYSRKWMPLYIAEVCWKYNSRFEDTEEVFEGFFRTLLTT